MIWFLSLRINVRVTLYRQPLDPIIFRSILQSNKFKVLHTGLKA